MEEKIINQGMVVKFNTPNISGNVILPGAFDLEIGDRVPLIVNRQRAVGYVEITDITEEGIFVDAVYLFSDDGFEPPVKITF